MPIYFNSSTNVDGTSSSSSSSSSTTDYTQLDNLPSINGVIITGELSLDDLGISTAFTYQGSVETSNDLPSSATNGDIYLVTDENITYIYANTEWVALGKLCDLSEYYTKEEIDDITNTLQDSITEINNAGYLTEIPAYYVTEEALSTTLTTYYVTADTFVQFTDNAATKDDIEEINTNLTTLGETVATNTESITTLESSLADKANTDTVYTKTEVDTLIGNLTQFKVKVVDELPTEDILTNVIYFVPKTGEQNDIYNEYIYINDAWELIGNTQIDLSSYVTEEALATALLEKVNTTDLANVAISGSYTDLINTPDLSNYVESSNLATIATSGSYNDLTDVPTAVTAFTNDANYITNAVNDLTNYYLKTETYTQDEVDNLIGAINTISIQVVDALPTTDIATNVIYFVQKTGANNDVYNEFIYINGAWELIGDTTVDLSNYVTTTTLTTELASKANTTDLAAVATSGSYNDLDNTPDLTIYATTSSLATVATTGSYNDLLNTPEEYTLPVATNTTLGGVIVDNDTITVTNTGVISATQQDLSSYITTSSVETLLADKVDTSSLATVATTGSYSDLIDTPNLNNYALTSSLATVATTGSYNNLIDTPEQYTLPVATATTLGGVIVDNNTITITEDGVISSVQQDLSDYVLTSSLSAVATTGSYNDLSNKPNEYTLPVATTSTLGGVIIDGSTITVTTDGTISATQQDLSNYATSSSLAAVATSGSYNDLTDTPNLTSYATTNDVTNAVAAITGEDVAYSSSDTTSLYAVIASLIERIEALENA